MSKPIYGNPEIDIKAKEITLEVLKITPNLCKNIDISTAKKLNKTLKMAVIQLEDAIATKLQQSIGGVIGNNRKQRKKRNKN